MQFLRGSCILGRFQRAPQASTRSILLILAVAMRALTFWAFEGLGKAALNLKRLLVHLRDINTLRMSATQREAAPP